jgi:hypothetical protein
MFFAKGKMLCPPTSCSLQYKSEENEKRQGMTRRDETRPDKIKQYKKTAQHSTTQENQDNTIRQKTNGYTPRR